MTINTNKKQVPVENHVIPEGGTLGILAAGYRGIMIWRQERFRLQQQRMQQALAKKQVREKK